MEKEKVKNDLERKSKQEGMDLAIAIFGIPILQSTGLVCLASCVPPEIDYQGIPELLTILSTSPFVLYYGKRILQEVRENYLRR